MNGLLSRFGISRIMVVALLLRVKLQSVNGAKAALVKWSHGEDVCVLVVRGNTIQTL